MLNLTPQYPNQIFLSLASSQLIAQVDAMNSSGILNRKFPKKFGRGNTGLAPDGSGAITTQIDVLINSNATYAFQNLNSARSYALEAASETINNACFYIENNPIQSGYYQIIVWSII